ncbi:hypothetical protein CVT24_009383 [Panaeolus cyanescens]|uniref:Uncharacterized protein n=1 Tax=Panaeolus cyanescens TaxID=181874 RepID=A0A409VCR3_9AGAR|nr:hypothetical protein CVT24_009383 [Panaeolus cyanescens]
MTSRLASFHGPSTPTASPVSYKPQNSPASPSRQTESTIHRKTRTLLQEIRSAAETWDDLVLVDGVKAIKELIDTRTDLENALRLVPDRKPRQALVTPKLDTMDACIVRLEATLLKLQKQFLKMNKAIDMLEIVLQDAYKTKGWEWVQSEPLWMTWPLEKFVTEIPSLLPAYHRSLDLHNQLVNRLRSHTIKFEESRQILDKWIEQPWLQEDGWDNRWEDICDVEVEKW